MCELAPQRGGKLSVCAHPKIECTDMHEQVRAHTHMPDLATVTPLSCHLTAPLWRKSSSRASPSRHFVCACQCTPPYKSKPIKAAALTLAIPHPHHQNASHHTDLTPVQCFAAIISTLSHRSTPNASAATLTLTIHACS